MDNLSKNLEFTFRRDESMSKKGPKHLKAWEAWEQRKETSALGEEMGEINEPRNLACGTMRAIAGPIRSGRKRKRNRMNKRKFIRFIR